MMISGCRMSGSNWRKVEIFPLTPSAAAQTTNCASARGNSASNWRTTPHTGSSAEATPNRICAGPG